jgi:hypothetical protein
MTAMAMKASAAVPATQASRRPVGYHRRAGQRAKPPAAPRSPQRQTPTGLCRSRREMLRPALHLNLHDPAAHRGELRAEGVVVGRSDDGDGDESERVVSGGLALALFISPYLGLAFAAYLAIPAWWLAYLALLGRPNADGTIEWYPTGRLLAWVAGTAALAGASLAVPLCGGAGIRPRCT